jgi:DNA-binding NarL/FixJ family response regulator
LRVAPSFLIPDTDCRERVDSASVWLSLTVNEGNLYSMDASTFTSVATPVSWPLAQSLLDLLTPRERAVLACLHLRHTNQEIALHLSVSPRTVESHVARILEKLGAANRREASVIAVRLEGVHGRQMVRASRFS